MLGGFGHLTLQPSEQRFLLAFQEKHDLVDGSVVLFFSLVADARRKATFDMILQARALASPVDRFATGAQRKYGSHEVDQFAQTVRVSVRPKIARAVVSDETREYDPRKRLVRYLQIRIPFIIAKANIEGRLVALDQVCFEDQRFDFVGDDDRSNLSNFLDHCRRARVMHRAFLEVRAYPVAQRDRLSYI